MSYRKTSIIKAFLLVLGLFASLGAGAAEQLVTDVNQAIIVRPAEPRVKVRLPANYTTGYEWVLMKYDSSLMEKPTNHYIAPHNGLMGAPGYVVWEFCFKRAAFAVPQKTTVILEYKRPWEETHGREQVIQMSIQRE